MSEYLCSLNIQGNDKLIDYLEKDGFVTRFEEEFNENDDENLQLDKKPGEINMGFYSRFSPPIDRAEELQKILQNSGEDFTIKLSYEEPNNGECGLATFNKTGAAQNLTGNYREIPAESIIEAGNSGELENVYGHDCKLAGISTQDLLAQAQENEFDSVIFCPEWYKPHASSDDPIILP